VGVSGNRHRHAYRRGHGGLKSQGQRELGAREVIFYGIVREQTSYSIELFVDRDDADAFIAEVRGDDPELASLLHVEEVDFSLSDV
jgi:hypothetical protein